MLFLLSEELILLWYLFTRWNVFLSLLELCHTCSCLIKQWLCFHVPKEAKKKEKLAYIVVIYSNIHDLFQLCCITVLVLLPGGTGAQAVGSRVRHRLGVLGQIKSLPFSSPAKEHGLIISLTSG